MHKNLRLFLVAWFLAFAGSQAVAQITISADDITGQFSADSTRRYFDTTTTTQVSIGDTAGATVWDFSLLRQDSSWTIQYVQPATTPFTADFPAASHAQKSDLTLTDVLPGVNATGTAYEYYKLDDYFVDFGIKGTGTVGGLISGTVVWTKVPADTLYKLPFTLGTQWGSTDSAITSIEVTGFYSSRTAKYESWDIVVDAYGVMTLPDATVHDALRIRKTPRPPATGTVSYSFVARDGAYVNFSALDAGAPLTGTVNIKNITWGPTVFDPPNAVASAPMGPDKFSLAQNFPNPFNPSTVIRYGLPGQSQVRLEIYNLIGQQVATLVNASQDAGYHEVQFSGANLPSGLYFYRLTAGGFVLTKKMMLTK
ncbi:MAG: Por secretion system C-terminal sorting protein [Bacteroidetes bacterium]|nr:Por secretion system C-terminal sorting protein [Bacteroidota bacterium]